jgi:hypothetical protein
MQIRFDYKEEFYSEKGGFTRLIGWFRGHFVGPMNGDVSIFFDENGTVP